MSLEMHVFLQKSRVPDRASWQSQINSLEMPLVLDPMLDILSDSGFSPAKVKDIDSGFEIYSEPSQELLQSYPSAANFAGDRDWCITFRWGGDQNECACVLAASAGLVNLCDAVAFYPDDDILYDLKQLVDEAKNCLGLTASVEHPLS